MHKRGITILLALLLVALIGLVWIVPRSMFLTAVVEHMCPGLIPASSYARNLDSGNADLTRESLSYLADRKNPIAIPRAIELLESTDDYIWLNAAHYVGACGRAEATPYLIKALRHTAWRADPETVQYLRSLTGQDFGADFPRWQSWWLERHPDASIDWTSHLGFSPRVSNIDKKAAK